MHILYLDDSGSIKNENEDYFVLGGVSVPERSIRWLSHKLETLAEEIDPTSASLVEFHAASVFSGREQHWKPFKEKAQRTEIIKKVLRCLDSANEEIVAFACAIHKKDYIGKDPVEMAFEDLSSRFNMYLERTSKDNSTLKNKGLIVLDKSSYENSLQHLAGRFRRDGNQWGSQLRSICEVPLFVDSKASRIIQLADHVSYAVFRRYNAGDINYFNLIESRFDQDPSSGALWGLVHKHTSIFRCTCPACLTRR